MTFKLDKSQKEIVNSKESHICVVAGAGSGKTRTLVERIRSLLQSGEDPSKFVCITFTRNAAQEMHERLADIPNSNKMFIGTIHSLAYKTMINKGKQPQLLTPDKEREFGEYLVKKYAKYITIDKYNEWKQRRHLQDIGYLKS